MINETPSKIYPVFKRPNISPLENIPHNSSFKRCYFIIVIPGKMRGIKISTRSNRNATFQRVLLRTNFVFIEKNKYPHTILLVSSL